MPDEPADRPAPTLDSIADDIRTMRVRGAGKISRHAVRGLVVWEESFRGPDATFATAAQAAADTLIRTRPSAVSLRNAVEFVMRRVEAAGDADAKRRTLHDAAAEFETRSLAAVDAIGRHGADLIAANGTFYTHCNSQAALSVFRSAKQAGRSFRVFADETRPWRQGYITVKQLVEAGVDTVFVVDAAAYTVLRKGVDAVIIGCDTIAANGDVVNKIGTSALALMCKDLGIPLYVCAETYKVARDVPTGRDVPIEEREPEEVVTDSIPVEVTVFNPVFDVTPAELVTGVITETGIVDPKEVAALAKKAWE